MKTDSLTVTERIELAQHEAVIERGLQTFVEVGQALLAIRDGRLYRQDHATFEDYCRERWGMSRVHAHRTIEAALVAENLLPMGNIPTNERQARPLTALEPDEQREVWQEAVETAPNGRVTAKHVEDVIARRNGNGHHELAAYEREYNRPVYDEGEGDTSWLDDDEYGRVLVENLDCAPARPQNISDDPDYDGNEWYTPVEYIEMARTLMGGIDTDPASCEWAQERVKAATYYTKDDDGLEQEWHGRVWLNPPYSWPEVEKFTRELCRQYDEGAVTEAVLVVNNSTDAAWFQALLRRFPVCFTAGRIKFERPGLEVFATRQGQAFFYLGDNVAGFAALFGEIGTVLGRLS